MLSPLLEERKKGSNEQEDKHIQRYKKQRKSPNIFHKKVRKMNKIKMKFWRLPQYTNNQQITVFLDLVFLLVISLGLVGCSTIKYVPIDTNTQVIVKDSIIHVRDTIRVEVPVEVVKEIVPQDTISVLRTSLAESTAKVINGELNHSLKQQGTVNARIDTCYVTKIEEKISYQEIPVEVIKEVKHIPDWVGYSLLMNILIIAFFGLKIYFKFKR